jgi:hypothetical protein
MRVSLLMFAVACSGAPSTKTKSNDPESDFGALEVGADYDTYTRLTSKPFLSLDHGNRWVHVYVNDVGYDAYNSSAAIPVGTIVVKTSFADRNGAPSDIEGPIYVMEKREPGYAPEDGDWWYAIRWAKPDDPELGGPIYWRGKSPRVDYCADCHNSYDRALGGLIPSSILKR